VKIINPYEKKFNTAEGQLNTLKLTDKT